MPDQVLRQTDALLTELTELVETARALPMSSSIVLPRERVLDLLDDLRDRMPTDIDEARRVLANRAQLLATAHADADTERERARADGAALLAEAAERGNDVVTEAQLRARELIEEAKAEHVRLVSAHSAHRAAVARAAELNAEADAYVTETRAAADRYAERTRARADQYGAALTNDANSAADRSLAQLAEALRGWAEAAEQWRASLPRTEPAQSNSPVMDDDAPTDVYDLDAAISA
jgi:hypothetical protein